MTEPWAAEAAPQADALVTRTPNIALGILTADCVPVLLAEPEPGSSVPPMPAGRAPSAASWKRPSPPWPPWAPRREDQGRHRARHRQAVLRGRPGVPGPFPGPVRKKRRLLLPRCPRRPFSLRHQGLCGASPGLGGPQRDPVPALRHLRRGKPFFQLPPLLPASRAGLWTRPLRHLPGALTRCCTSKTPNCWRAASAAVP